MLDDKLEMSELKAFLADKLSTRERRALRVAGSTDEVSTAEYGSVVSSVMSRVVARHAKVNQQRQSAEGLFQELMVHPEERRQVLVRNSARFRNWHLCTRLVEESIQAGSRFPRQAIHLAQLAIEVAEKLNAEDYAPGTLEDLKARCFSCLSNARRMNGEVTGAAEEAMMKAEMHLAQGTSDPLEEAKLTGLKGALRGEQRRYDECLALFDHAASIYQRYGENHLQGRMLMKKGIFCGAAGDPEQAIKLYLRSLDLVDVAREPRLKVAATQNLIISLNEMGRYQEAAEMLNEQRVFLQEFGDRIDRLRLRWLEGRIARGHGDLEQAEVALSETLAAFMSEGIALDVALASLELAEIYLEQGRTAEIKRVVEEILPCFKASDLHREAFAAIILFQRAAEMERVTLGLIQDSIAKLSKTRHN